MKRGFTRPTSYPIRISELHEMAALLVLGGRRKEITTVYPASGGTIMRHYSSVGSNNATRNCRSYVKLSPLKRIGSEIAKNGITTSVD